MNLEQVLVQKQLQSSVLQPQKRMQYDMVAADVLSRLETMWMEMPRMCSPVDRCGWSIDFLIDDSLFKFVVLQKMHQIITAIKTIIN